MCVDVDFSTNWDPIEPELDRDTKCSYYGYIITYIDTPIIWKLQLQNEITLSSTKSEYIDLSYTLREIIPIINLLKEIKAYQLKFVSDT